MLFQNKLEPLLSSISPSYNDQEFPDFKKVEDNTKDKEGDLKNDDMQTNKKIPYDLRNKSLEKMPNFYNEKIAESNFKNEYDFSISLIL